MEARPPIFLVRGIDRRASLRCAAYVHYDSIHARSSPHCTCCGRRFDVNRGPLLVYSSELQDIAESGKGFVLCDDDYNLLAPEDEIREIAGLITGALPLRAGYGTMYEDAIPGREDLVFAPHEWFTVTPHLAIVRVTGKCTNAFGRSGQALPRCEECGRLREFSWSSVNPDHVSLDIDAWDGTEIFKLEGSYRPILTQSALSKIEGLGFSNLVLHPLKWL